MITDIDSVIIMKRKTTFRDKGMRCYLVKDRLKYDRSYVKKTVDDETTFLSFSRSSYIEMYDDYEVMNDWVSRYVMRVMQKLVGNPMTEVNRRLDRMGWKYIHNRERVIKRLMTQAYPLRFDAWHPFYVDDDGILRNGHVGC